MYNSNNRKLPNDKPTIRNSSELIPCYLKVIEVRQPWNSPKLISRETKQRTIILCRRFETFRFVNLTMKELSRTHEWPTRLSLIVILLRYDVLGTIDVNLNELEYLAARLNPFECRRLIAALHYITYDLPNNLAAAGKSDNDRIEYNSDHISSFYWKKYIVIVKLVENWGIFISSGIMKRLIDTSRNINYNFNLLINFFNSSYCFRVGFKSGDCYN